MTISKLISHLRLRQYAVLFALVSSTANAETWVISDQAHPIKASAGMRVIMLDEQLRLENDLTQAMGSNPHQAALKFQQYMATPAGARIQAALAKAQQDVADAWGLRIEKIPAVVVDRKYVVYGATDATAAVELINKSRGAQR